MKWNIPAEVLTKSRLLNEPGWHPIEPVAVKDTLSKDKESTNTWVTLRIYEGPYTGVEINQCFNEKELGQELMMKWLSACGVNVVSGFNGDVDMKTVAGLKCRAFIKRGSYNDKPQNQIEEFAPLVS